MPLRRDRAGSPMRIVELRCRRCARRLLLSQGEATPPQPNQVPYCGDCLKDGVRVILSRREFRSGPPDLRV